LCRIAISLPDLSTDHHPLRHGPTGRNRYALPERNFRSPFMPPDRVTLHVSQSTLHPALRALAVIAKTAGSLADGAESPLIMHHPVLMKSMT
jgi:hypothetical protein